MSNIEYFLSIHQILIPNDKFNLVYFDEKYCKINYLNEINKTNESDKPDERFEIKYTYMVDNNELILNVLTESIFSNHIKRLLENKKLMSIKFNENIITEFLFGLGELIDKYFNYCTICGTELKIKGIQSISCCANIDCIEKSYQTVIDDKVTNSFKRDSQVFLFLLDILITGTLHLKGELAYKPIPCITGIKNLSDLKKLLEKEKNLLQEDTIIKILNECENDIDLINKTNPQIYAILKNAVSNNYFSMSSRDNDLTSSLKKNNSNTNAIKFIHINYSADIENKFTQKYFLFHGSGICSWYPIIKNGLKVMSGTEFMANGAAHGNGIYFSDSFQMSHSYSYRGKGEGMIRNSNNVVGVFEVLEDPSKYKKVEGIYVINNDKIVLLRTIVLVKSGSTIPKDISNYFLKELPLQKQTNKLNVGILKNKRLDGEHKKLLTLNFITKIDIQDQWKWIIDFEPIKNNYPSIEFVFSNYPINPPIIKLLSKQIKITGLVDSNGIITIETTNPANWKLTNNLGEICTILYKCFQESL